MEKKLGIDTDEIFDEEMKELGKAVLPDPDLLDYYKRLINREIFWNDYVDDNLVNMSLQILKWNQEDKGLLVEKRKAIKIFINSDGGEVDAVMNFIDTIKLSKTPVITVGMGKCYSSGGLMLMAGKMRLIFPNTKFLVHDGQGGAVGNTGKVLDNLEFTQKLEKRIKQYILEQTKITEKEYDKNYRRDWFMFADEIIKYGIADRIITDLDEIL